MRLTGFYVSYYIMFAPVRLPCEAKNFGGKMKDFPEKIWLESYFSLSLQRQNQTSAVRCSRQKAAFIVP
jgi:hypothetical protein